MRKTHVNNLIFVLLKLSELKCLYFIEKYSFFLKIHVGILDIIFNANPDL